MVLAIYYYLLANFLLAKFLLAKYLFIFPTYCFFLYLYSPCSGVIWLKLRSTLKNAAQDDNK
jgi:hypothetical protein